MDRQTILELIKKVKKLADAGVGGEADAAKEKFQRLCKKYNFSEEDFVSVDPPTNRFIIIRNKFDKTLLSNIICMILEVPAFHWSESKNTVKIKLTDQQYDDIINAYDYYKSMFDDYCRYLIHGIMSRNAIGYIPKSKPTETSQSEDVKNNDKDSENIDETSQKSEASENISEDVETPIDPIKLMKIAVALDKNPWSKPDKEKNLQKKYLSDSV
jgi:hypothetical protein